MSMLKAMLDKGKMDPENNLKFSISKFQLRGVKLLDEKITIIHGDFCLRWRLHIHDQYVAVRLEIPLPQFDRADFDPRQLLSSSANILVCIFDREGKVFYEEEAQHRFNRENPVFERSKFYCTRDLLGNPNLFWPDGTLKILFQFCLGKKPRKIRVNPKNVKEFGSLQGDAFFEPKGSECERMLSDQFGALLLDPKFADVTLCIGEMEFPAHKAVLAVRCPVFEAMFETDMLEKRKNKVEIKDVEPQILREMLEFIYTGKAPNIDEIAQDMLLVADRYLVEQLKCLAEGSLARKLTITNATDLLMLADSCTAENLLKEAVKFIGTNLESVRKQSNWHLVKENSQLMHHISEFMAVNAKIIKS